MADFQKAFICPFKNNVPVTEERFYVQFNPAEISIEEAIGISGFEEENAAAAFGAWRPDFQKPVDDSFYRKKKDELTFSATLFFNTLESLGQTDCADVRTYVRQLYRYANKSVKADSQAEQICFSWGSIVVAGMLTRLSVRYTLFAPNGKPVRAEADISITGDYCGEQHASKISVKKAEDKSMADWRGTFIGKGNPRLWERQDESV